ncbi:MAG: ribosome maturation factor [Bacilli bacterium]
MNYIPLLQQICEKACLEVDMYLVSVDWEKRGDDYVVCVIADSADGVDLEKATKLNSIISDALDIQNFITEEYLLEVSSPGAEREIRDDTELEKALDEYIHIDFIEQEPIEKLRKVLELEGYLKAVAVDTLTLEVNLKGRIKKVNINRDNIKLIRKAIKF